MLCVSKLFKSGEEDVISAVPMHSELPILISYIVSRLSMDDQRAHSPNFQGFTWSFKLNVTAANSAHLITRTLT